MIMTEKVLEAIRYSLWGKGQNKLDQDIYEVFKKHAILSLSAPCLSNSSLPAALHDTWKKAVIMDVTYYMRYKYEQSALPITVPYVILKGTAAAQYYPHPEYRSMGDIDIITRREDFDQAYRELLENGYQVTKEIEREIGFVKNGITIELHRFFASLNNEKQAKYLDDLIIENINDSHALPDDINGLVILEHINQHLEKGLGLRQIIDWMMFVDKCLPDDKWPSFRNYAKSIGLETLAVVTTRMCELYLGLSRREWCARADEKHCMQLMDYILSCGNFGYARAENIGTADNVFYHGKNLKDLFALLQNRGMVNWEAAKKHACLRPFAWIYQIVRYTVKGLDRDKPFMQTKKEYSNARQRNKLFRDLGVKQASKGISVYRDGEYRKDKKLGE